MLRGLGLVLFGVGLTWFLTVVLGRAVSRRGFAFWVWDRSGSIGRVLIAVGFGIAVIGLAQGAASATGSSKAAPARRTVLRRTAAPHPIPAVPSYC